VSARARCCSSTPTGSYFEGRAQNHLLPEHIEKIVTTFDDFRAIDGFSAIVDNATLKANDYNLNIRRYADNAPPPEPHDVRAHLVGGIPKAEVAAKAPLFSAHGLNPLDLLVERDARYFDFAPALHKRQAIKPAIEGNAHLMAKEAAVRAAFEQWWHAHRARIPALQGAASAVATREDLLHSFATALEPVGLLDVFQVRGISAGFWYDNLNDFKTIMARGPLDLIRGWRDHHPERARRSRRPESQSHTAGPQAGPLPDEPISSRPSPNWKPARPSWTARSRPPPPGRRERRRRSCRGSGG
jgi:type I restriction enzyme M protein